MFTQCQYAGNICISNITLFAEHLAILISIKYDLNICVSSKAVESVWKVIV